MGCKCEEEVLNRGGPTHGFHPPLNGFELKIIANSFHMNAFRR